MAQIAKVEPKAEIKCAPAKMYDFWKYNKSQFTNLFPLIFKSMHSIEGQEGEVGNVFTCEYFLGKANSVKVKTEEINDEKRSITMRAIEGDIMQLYSSFVANVTVNDGSAEWCLEFEKKNDSAPNPDIYANLALEVTKGIDLYLLNN